MLLVPGAAGGDQVIERRQPGLVVVAQAARVVEPDARDPRARGADLDHLVDLLLVLDDREGDVGIADREHVLGRGRVLVEGHRDRAQRLRRQHRRIEARPVLADHHQMLAALQPGLGEAAGHRPDQRRELAPGERLPDAEVLLAQRRRRRAASGVVEQEAGKGRRHDQSFERRQPRAGRPRVSPDSRKILTSSCRSADNLRDNTLGCIPRPAPRQALIETVPVKLDTAVSPPPASGRTTSMR